MRPYAREFPRVVVIAPVFRAEASQIAIALSECGIPFRFHTSAYIDTSSRLGRGIEVLPKRLRVHLWNIVLRRYEPNLDSSRVTNWLFPDLGFWIARRLRLADDLVHPLINLWFDRLVSRVITSNVAVVVSMQGSSLESIRQAHRHNAKTMLIVNTPDPFSEAQIIVDEEARLGLGKNTVKPSTARFAGRIRTEQAEADVILANSEFTRRDLVAHGVEAKKVITVPLGVDLDLFVPLTRHVDRSRLRAIVYVGSVQARKGVIYLARAVQELRNSGIACRLDAYGLVHPGYATVLASFVDEGSLTLRGPVPYDRLPSVYGAADVFVFPTLSDGFGLVVLEAMACGSPVIVTNRCGAPIEDGVNGLVVPHRDVHALRVAIERVLTEDGLADTLRAAGLETARACSWSSYRAAVVEHLTHLTGRRSTQNGPKDDAWTPPTVSENGETGRTLGEPCA